MLLALVGDPARGEQDADEHERDRGGDHNPEGVQGRAPAVQEPFVNGDGWLTVSDTSLLMPRSGGEAREARDLSHLAEFGAGGQLQRDRVQHGGI